MNSLLLQPPAPPTCVNQRDGRSMWSPRRVLMVGVPEDGLKKVLACEGWNCFDVELTPRSTQSEITRGFRACGNEACRLLIRMADSRSGHLKTMDRSQQESLIPFIDDFSGILLILYSPIFLPIVKPIRSRCELSELEPKFEVRKPKGRLNVLSQAIADGSDHALSRSFASALEEMIRKSYRGGL